MSSRVLRKLHGDKDLASTLGIDGMSESDDGGIGQIGADNVTKPLANNRFELLNSVEHSLSDTEAKEDDDREVDPPHEDQERKKLEKQDSTHSTDSLKRKKKKKKKKLKSQKSTEENLDDAEDEVEASIREVNKILGEPEASSVDATAMPATAVAENASLEKSLLAVDLRNLNPDNEMKRIFGSKVIQSEQVSLKRRGRGRTHGRSSILVSPKNWPHVGKPGISMLLIEKKGDILYFTFEHSKQYQATQQRFLEAVESFNPDNIVDLLNVHPYHIDALLQFSDICRMGEDMQMAAELIERALYCMESCCHPLFTFAQGNCRLDYRRAENRSFYIALFKHLTFVGQRGCTRTALEFCKFLLSLDVEGDPLCVTLMLDYYALRCVQYDYLIKLFKEWNVVRNLSQLPNFAFSVPLAMYFKAVNEKKPTDEADSMLQDSLIMFPGFLMPLLDKCSVQPDAEVSSHAFFNARSNASNAAPALAQLIALYIGRTYMLWKAADVILWLEGNVRKVLLRLKSNDPYVAECAEKRKMRYKGAPRNILRHIILSNIKEATITLPQDLTQSPIFGFDPLPPTDAITTYTRPLRPSPVEDRGALSMFFRSLLPDFNAAHDVGAAAERGDTNDLRRSVTSLLDAMRDLLSNIELVDVPNEGDVDSDEEHRQ